MSSHPVRKTTHEGMHACVVEQNGVRQVCVTAVPRCGGSLREQVRDALSAIDRVMRAEGAAAAVVQQTVFMADAAPMAACRQGARDFYGTDLPATSYIPQPPCDGSLLTIEALGLASSGSPLDIHRLSEQLVVVRHHGSAWVFASQAVPRTSAPGTYEKTICAFQHLRRLLPRADARLDQVIRTWLYLGDIVAEEGDSQRYKELNRGRTDCFEGVHFLQDLLPKGSPEPVFPASTGIGTNGRGLSISALAIVSDADDVLAVPLENPRQTSAFAYAASYSPKSPKFSRAMALCHGPDTTLFISGTASITNSETRHLDDPVAQTHETLDNIAALISQDNLARHGLPGRGTSLDGLGVIRVYIKNLADYPAIRAACESRLGAVPAAYVVADVCRDDLLVEIEGIAYAERAGPPLAAAHHPCRGRHALTVEKPMLCPHACPERLDCPLAVLPNGTHPAGVPLGVVS